MALRTVARMLFATLVAVEAAKVTPIEKVTQLLKGLQAKVVEEGKKEAAAYDKYACFCKEQADGKRYNIERSTDKIDKLSEEIKSLDADLSELDGDISELSNAISGLEEKISDDADERAKDHAQYLARAKDLSEAIDACVAAIAAMKDSKGGLSDAKVNLVQVHSRLLATASRQKVPAGSMDLIQQLSARLTGGPAKFTFQGNDIIALLEDLLSDFKQSKADMDRDEFDIKSVFEKDALGATNEKKFVQAEKDEKSALSEEKSEAVNAAREDHSEEKNKRAADQLFLDTLTVECEAKGKLFDQRSSIRAQELTAMTEAIDILKSGVAGNEGANKKLTGLLQGGDAPSFVQINRNRGSSVRTLQQDSNRAVKHVLQLIQDAATRLDSKVLQGAAVRVQLTADHFVKVRLLIKDLIAGLERNAEDEASQKSFCDDQLHGAISHRDEAKSEQEASNADLTSLTSLKEDLENSISDLGAGIAASKKALFEATALRYGEKDDNEASMTSAKDGLAATNLARKVLNDFYQNAFLQVSSKYTPPKADREGKTVGDLAPDTFDEEYHGAGAESKGIMGILEVIASDFERTISTVREDEKGAVQEYDNYETENSRDVQASQDAIDKKTNQLKGTEADMLDMEQKVKDTTEMHNGAMEELDTLKESCVEGEETWEDRAANRKKEIQALKDAQRILDEWQA